MKKGKYQIGLMIVSILVIFVVFGMLAAFPVQGTAVAANLMNLLTRTFGSFTQILAMIILIFLVALACSKYGEIRFGNKKPQYRTGSWIAMMFFSGLGAGTVYWAFLEWGYHFNAAPQLEGAKVTASYAYELSLAYTFFDWGPSAWALLCIFVLPFGYHIYIKKDKEVRLSALCKYTVGEKRVKGWFGKIVDFIFIFAAVGAICISAGSCASTISSALAGFLGIPQSFTLSVIVLVFGILLYPLTKFLKMSKGMSKISDWNTYLCIFFLLCILILGPTRFILDSVVNSFGVMANEFLRMSLFTDPAGGSGYPQDWTVFYLIYWFVFGPFTGLFIAKVSEGRKIKEIILNMLVTGTAGLLVFFGIIGAYEQHLRIEGILDIPQMLLDGKAASIAEAVIGTLPFSKVFLLLYLIIIILFLAATLNSSSYTLASTVSKEIKEGEDPGDGLKFIWSLVLIVPPMAVTYIGTDITTIKAAVLASGMPLIIILAIIYKGFLKEMKKDFGKKSKEEIIEEGTIY